MSPKYEATQAALERFDAVDMPALEAMHKRNGAAVNLSGVTQAEHAAADRVREAYLRDTQDFHLAQDVELMSVDAIRKAVGGTLLGKILGVLP